MTPRTKSLIRLIRRMIGGAIWAFSIFYLIGPALSPKAVFGIALGFLGFYVATDLPLFSRP